MIAVIAATKHFNNSPVAWRRAGLQPHDTATTKNTFMQQTQSPKAGERTQLNAYTLSFHNQREGVKWVGENGNETHLDLGSGVVGCSVGISETGLNRIRHDFALLLAKYPQATGKVGVYRCPFAFAKFDTFELVEDSVPDELLALAKRATQFKSWHMEDAFRRGQYQYFQPRKEAVAV